ncbi:HAD-IB family phosphatase [Candidatus Pacearchaeota archaeon]|nr:HAD-IB family phosphatase [Candidatus Pacearchaeota archaeon]
MEDKKIKLIFFDMEGTLFKKIIKFSKGNTTPSAWTLIAKHLGPEALKEEEETKDKWNNNKYAGYVEWMEDTIKIHQKYGLTKNFFDKVMDSVEYHNGVKETFKILNEKGYRTVLVSGGFKANADRAQKDLKIDHSFAACEYFWDEKGKLIHWNLLPCDYEGKYHFIKLIMKEHGRSPDECAFVGDGINDVHLAKEVGVGISFNGHEELQRVSTHVINQEEGKEDFREILKYL